MSRHEKLKSQRRSLFLFALSFQFLAVITILVFALLYLTRSIPVSVYLGFLTRDFLPIPEKYLFVLGLVVAYLLSVIIGTKSIPLPSYDFFNGLIVTNLIVFLTYGFVLGIFDVGVLSSRLLLYEILLTTFFLLTYFHLKLYWFPPRIGVVGRDVSRFRHHQNIEWISCEELDDSLGFLDGFTITLQSANETEQSKILLKMTHRNIPVFHERALHEQLSGQMDLSHLTGEELEGFQPPRVYFVVKRFGELMVVVVALPLLLLLSLIAAILVKAESTGPVFFRQTRIGLHGQRFSITKFRTMVHNNGNSNKSQFADLQDNRVTRVGRWLRHYRLDEIPQIWNVVRGDMSLIGPRPEQPTFVEQFKTNIPYYDYRHTVRPGIAGWAQVRYGYASTEDQTRSKLEYDFFYIKHMSLWLDFNILLRTLRTILLRKGAR